jgi:hypothetical protein
MNYDLVWKSELPRWSLQTMLRREREEAADSFVDLYYVG